MNKNSKENTTMNEKRICVICGAEYTPKSPSQVLCGKVECKRARHRQYVQQHAEMYRILNREYRKKEENKAYRAEYDREYQKKNKQRIKEYKQAYWKKKFFFQKLEQGILLQNSYWFSLPKEEQERITLQLQQA